jgi:hypothetical protein
MFNFALDTLKIDNEKELKLKEETLEKLQVCLNMK